MGSLGRTSADKEQYDELVGEIHRIQNWLKSMASEARQFEQKIHKTSINGGLNKVDPQIKAFLHDVQLHKNQVQGLIAEGLSYLEKDPDTLLYIVVNDLEKSWSELQANVRCFSRSNLNITPQINFYFVKQGSPFSPLYNKIPFSRERKITVELPKGRSLLAEKGRTHVAKLSIPYRALIKSKVKSRWHRSKVSDTKSEILISDTKSEDSNRSFDKNSKCIKNLLSKIRNRSRSQSGLHLSSNLGSMRCVYPESFDNLSNMDLSMLELENCIASSSPQPNPRLGPRLSPPMEDDSPNSKRRRMNNDTPSSVSSGCRSAPQSPMFGPHHFVDPSYPQLDDVNDSSLSSPTGSPNLSLDFTKTVKKDELWPSIKSDYQFLMDEEIIATCKSTESDFSCTEDEGGNVVSFAELIQQFNELIDWLKLIQRDTHSQGSSLSEKYLNQSYHKEMLHKSSRRRLFQDYAKQLQRRYPDLRNQIALRVQQLNLQWQALEDALCPDTYTDEEHMLNDLESDLNSLKRWLNDTEYQLRYTTYVDPSWTREQLQAKLERHSVVQHDIESHSKIVSAVLKLCERLKLGESLSLVATNLQTRWHAIWIKSLEWQCRLEEALNVGRVPRKLFGEWMNYSDCQSPEVSRSCNTECVDKIKHPDLDDDNNYLSDITSDIIPFADSEYEKIVVESDSQTDDFVDGFITSPAVSGRMIDSALGRSVSDHSDGGEMLLTRNAGMILKLSKGKMESHDVGYSSESHSNEEHEVKKVEGEPDVIIEETEAENASMGSGLIDACKLGSQSRHSMTSAYDTSSNCSDHPELEEGEGALEADAGKDEADHAETESSLQKVEHICNSPTQQFYKVTAVENDTENDNILVTCTSEPQKMMIPIIHSSIGSPSWVDDCELGECSDDGEICLAFSQCEEVPSGSLSVEADSDVSHQDVVFSSLGEIEGEPDTCLNTSQPPHISNKLMKKLIQQAELLVMDESLVETREKPKVKMIRSRKRKASQGRTGKTGSKDGSMASSEGEESCVSSCEAYSVYSSGSESEADWSSSEMSDLGVYYNSTDDLPTKIRRKSRNHERNGILSMDMSPFSISESAIDDIHMDDSSLKIDLRKCRSETSHLEQRRHRYKRRHDSRSTTSCASSFDDSSVCVICPVVAESKDDVGNSKKSMSATDSHTVATDDYHRVTTDNHIVIDTGTSAAESIDIAWDDYQAAPYSFNDAPKLEDKLDDSVLLWEESYFDLDEQSDCPQMAKSPRKLLQLDSYDSDDSDMEDLVHILKESKLHLQLATDMTEKEQLDPAKYREVVATCKTNINCLADIKETLVEGLNIDTHHVQVVIDQWCELEVVASLREHQAKDRNYICQDIMEVDDLLLDYKDSIEAESYTNVDDLVTHIQSLQYQKSDLPSCHAKVLDISTKVDRFMMDHPNVTTEEFMTSLLDMQQRIDQLEQCCDQRISLLKNLLLQWYELHELQRELVYLMEQEDSHLKRLILSQDDDNADKISDLKLMKETIKEWKMILDNMRQNCTDLEQVCSEEAQGNLRTVVTEAEMTCCGLECSIKTLLMKLEGSRSEFAIKDSNSLRSLAVRLGIPLSIAICAAYLVYPEIWDRTFGLTLEPQLRYINGPPPT